MTACCCIRLQLLPLLPPELSSLRANMCAQWIRGKRKEASPLSSEPTNYSRADWTTICPPSPSAHANVCRRRILSLHRCTRTCLPAASKQAESAVLCAVMKENSLPDCIDAETRVPKLRYYCYYCYVLPSPTFTSLPSFTLSPLDSTATHDATLFLLFLVVSLCVAVLFAAVESFFRTSFRNLVRFSYTRLPLYCA